MAPASPSGTATVGWRTPAVRYAIDELGLPDDRLIRIVDVRVVRHDEAWVALLADRTPVVVGLRRETCAGGGASDGWFRLLYLDAGGTVLMQPPAAGHDTHGGGAPLDGSAAGRKERVRG